MSTEKLKDQIKKHFMKIIIFTTRVCGFLQMKVKTFGFQSNICVFV